MALSRCNHNQVNAYEAFYTRRIEPVRKDAQHHSTDSLHLSRAEGKWHKAGLLSKLIRSNGNNHFTLLAVGRFQKPAN